MWLMSDTTAAVLILVALALGLLAILTDVRLTHLPRYADLSLC